MRAPFCQMVLIVLVCVINITSLAQSPNLRAQMKSLAPLVGEWSVNTEMIDWKTQKRTQESGRYAIRWILDSTYLQIEAHLSTPMGSSRKFLCLITYDHASSAYLARYFYSGTSFTVNETGSYDAHNSTFSTNGKIVYGGSVDGIRTLLDMKDRNHMKFSSWGRPGGRTEEFLDFTADLVRISG